MIPKIIHQTWKSKGIPGHLRGFQESWLRHHPDWEYRLWDDDDNEQLLAERYPEFLEYYRHARSGILRIDLIRLAYLHLYGGVYADLDYEVLRPLDDLLDTSRAIVGRERGGIGLVLRGRDYIINALMASPPGHPLWLDVMHGMIRARRPRRWLESHTSYYMRMGIGVLDEQVEARHRACGDVVVLPCEALYPAAPTDRVPARRLAAAGRESYGVHHYDNSWRTPLARLINRGRAFMQRCS